MTHAAVEKHLTVLSNGGLITTRVSGRERFNALDPNGFAPMRDWIKFFDQFWGNQLTNLKDIIEKKRSKGTTPITKRIIRKSIFLNADRQTVWAYLTDPDKLAIWFHTPKNPFY